MMRMVHGACTHEHDSTGPLMRSPKSGPA